MRRASTVGERVNRSSRNRNASSNSPMRASGRLIATTISGDGQDIIFPLKKDSVIEETRQSERFSFTAEEKVICEILNPYDGSTKLSKSVMDMSATGLSLRTTFESKLFRPGTQLEDIKVLIGGEPYTQTSGTVVYTRKLLDLKNHLRLQVGIQFEGGQ